MDGWMDLGNQDGGNGIGSKFKTQKEGRTVATWTCEERVSGLVAAVSSRDQTDAHESRHHLMAVTSWDDESDSRQGKLQIQKSLNQQEGSEWST